ncbi:Serine/threonine protein kinase PrkC, regulator of stationary phase [Enhygromyxa salina]|uniref:Serine/threonine protein kinase PrkC, regulator of stationary phase n=2 Tax=Enhygromyxa salina TaxID=215803 RepID=A0A0C1ZKF3_9BACT|nr:Serine/threonine protein kinase PrkC, regulator of stationary phase [Enhygromyxa salina]
MDIMAVAAKIKDQESEDGDSDMSPGDSGLILFTAGDDEPSAGGQDDDALFGSFAGGLGAGFGPAAEPLVGTSASPLADASVASATPAVAADKPAESKRSPLVFVALLLGLGVVGGGIMLMSNNREQPDPQANAQVAPTDGDAAVGKAEPTPDPNAEQAGASAGAAVEPQPEPEPEADTEGLLLEGETEGAGLGLLADGDDPMGMREGLLESDGTNGVAKVGKWDQGKSSPKPANTGADPAPKPEPEPDPEPDFDPLPEPKKGGKVSEEDVDCLLNPDLAKCQGGGGQKPKNEEVLAPKLPEKLSAAQLRQGFNKIKAKAKTCGLKHNGPSGTSVKIHVSIQGATGTVDSVKALGEHAGTPLGNCVEDTVKGAVFEQFKTPSMGIDYPVIM